MDTQNKLDPEFIPVSTKKLLPNEIIHFDLYTHAQRQFVLYKSKNLPLDTDDLKRLRDMTVETLYIHRNDQASFKEYLEVNIDTYLNSADAPLSQKAEILYESAITVVEDIFENPRSGETIKRSRKIIGKTVDFILNESGAFSKLLEIRRHDFYTYTHSVNVCTFLISLARELGLTDRGLLFQVGEGGLLHDLGKNRIPPGIINKNGPLNKEEWDIMRSHALLGAAIAKETRDVSPISVSIIGQHHEKINGRGYPLGLSGSELDQYAQMASIVDVYDALTTNRPYAAARPPMKAAQILLESHQEFNPIILKKFIRMLAIKGEHS